jgi:CDP-diacylglycerol--glycerol-3-phosphate 3-phosphatidyltransferase
MKITANAVTMTRIVLLPLMAALLYGDLPARLWGLGLLIVLGLTDYLDGYMARKEGPSVLGGLLDPIADKIFVAVLFLPLTDIGIVPLWMAISMFCRDFLVTSLRTSLSLRDAPMRTSTLAKYKTAAQMVGAGYVLLYITAPYAWWSWVIIAGACLVPLSAMLLRRVQGKKQGKASVTLAIVMALAVLGRWLFGVDLAIYGTLVIVTALTLVSGFSYLVDAWAALRGMSGGWKELARFVVDGLLLPAAAISLLAFYHSLLATASVILVITVDFALGGLSNLLASKKLTMRFRWMTAKSLSQLVLCAVALLDGAGLLHLPPLVSETFIALAAGISVLTGVLSFTQHRRVYLDAL